MTTITRWCPSTSWSYQAALSVQEGLDPDTALRALTINPAGIAGIDGRLARWNRATTPIW